MLIKRSQTQKDERDDSTKELQNLALVHNKEQESFLRPRVLETLRNGTINLNKGEFSIRDKLLSHRI